jgi:hypothetical protein
VRNAWNIARVVALVSAMTACSSMAEPADPGSLCACAMVGDEEVCCNGNGVCIEQEEGPRRCECHEGARGDTCATPPPGTHGVTERDCEGDDPACMQAFDFVVVDAFDDCPDLDGEPIASVIVRPAADDSGTWPHAPDPSPAAILVHGASQAHSDYYDLVEHLAANGIVTASIDATFAGDVTARANRLLSYLTCLRDEWPDRDRLAPGLAFVGHSRGGAAAAVAANAIAEGVLPGDSEVAAAVLLAPSASGLFALQHTDTPAVLVLQGSRDPDTTGAGLSWYDLAGDESTDATDVPDKSLVWAFGATHHRFHQGLVPATGELEATIDGPAHWTISRAYVGAFLLWHMLGRDDMRSYLADGHVPTSVLAIWEPEPPGVFPQLSQGIGADLQDASRRIIHDFESGELSPSAVGGTVTASSLDRAEVGELEGNNPPYSGRQRTVALAITWSDDASDPRVVFELPAEAADLTGFAVVSVRAGQPFARRTRLSIKTSPSRCAMPPARTRYPPWTPRSRSRCPTSSPPRPWATGSTANATPSTSSAPSVCPFSTTAPPASTSPPSLPSRSPSPVPPAHSSSTASSSPSTPQRSPPRPAAAGASSVPRNSLRIGSTRRDQCGPVRSRESGRCGGPDWHGATGCRRR